MSAYCEDTRYTYSWINRSRNQNASLNTYNGKRTLSKDLNRPPARAHARRAQLQPPDRHIRSASRPTSTTSRWSCGPTGLPRIGKSTTTCASRNDLKS